MTSLGGEQNYYGFPFGTPWLEVKKAISQDRGLQIDEVRLFRESLPVSDDHIIHKSEGRTTVVSLVCLNSEEVLLEAMRNGSIDELEGALSAVRAWDSPSTQLHEAEDVLASWKGAQLALINACSEHDIDALRRALGYSRDVGLFGQEVVQAEVCLRNSEAPREADEVLDTQPEEEVLVANVQGMVGVADVQVA